MSPIDHQFLFCPKREQRLSVSVCIFRKCRHLREDKGNFDCKFQPKEQKRIEKRKEGEE